MSLAYLKTILFGRGANANHAKDASHNGKTGLRLAGLASLALARAGENIPTVERIAFSRDDHADETEALMIARRAIAMAALTDEQKTTRLADLHRDSGLAAFWARMWPEL